jgi:tetraacyldisaccharide-1-P 4'-kinase
MGFVIDRSFSWPDHHIFKEKDIDYLKSWNLPLITTEKDAMRLEKFRTDDKISNFNFHVLKIEIKIKKENAFLRRLLMGKEKKNYSHLL